MKLLRIFGILAVFIFTLIFPLLFPNPAVTTIGVFSLLYACAATGWNIFSGYTGYTSLGYATFYGLGGYSLALMVQFWNIPGGYEPFLLVPVAGLITALAAVPIGWIALRIRGHNFVVITIAIVFIFQLLAYNLQFITNGNSGLTFPLPPWSGESFNIPFYYVSLLLVVVAIVISWWIRHSKYGLGLLAIRDDEGRARSLGVRTGPYKLVAFTISAFLGGMMGAMVFYFIGSLYPPSAFDPTFDIAPVLMTFLGGAATLTGPLIGAVILEPLQQYMILQLGSTGFDLFFFGMIMLLVIFKLPRGMVPTIAVLWSKRKVAPKPGRHVSSVEGKEKAVLAESGGGGKE
jgi:branched-chain amino acid transport system permease protein